MAGILFVTKSVLVWCRLLISSHVVRAHLPWMMKLLSRGFVTTELLRQIGRVQRKTLSAFEVFLVPTIQNNEYIKVAYSANLKIHPYKPLFSSLLDHKNHKGRD